MGSFYFLTPPAKAQRERGCVRGDRARGQGQAGPPGLRGQPSAARKAPPSPGGRDVLSPHWAPAAVCKQCLGGEHPTLPVAKALEGAVIRVMAVITGLWGTRF